MYKNWRAQLRGTVGARHTHEGKECQDFGAWQYAEGAIDNALVIAVADGHGAKIHFNSKRGAELAVASAIDRLLDVMKMRIQGESLSFIKRYVSEILPEKIVKTWRDFIAIEKGTDSSFLTSEILVPYGSTLLAGLLTDEFICYVQLGDGVIVESFEKGVYHFPFGQGIFSDEKTDSMCLPTAARDMKVYFQLIEEESPEFVLFTTDGFPNSYETENDFLLTVEAMRELCQSQLSNKEAQLDEWMQEITAKGSGDDITVGLLFRS